MYTYYTTYKELQFISKNGQMRLKFQTVENK